MVILVFCFCFCFLHFCEGFLILGVLALFLIVYRVRKTTKSSSLGGGEEMGGDAEGKT